ncbi:MAG: polysaccharide biosynthesis/export family protein [Myxococcales bacterium]|nr:polysaccharide biosynthesis/export family protein [Myxococcales bacterium]
MPIRTPSQRLRACALLAVVALVGGGCATTSYRYDHLDEEDGVEVKDLEDLLADSQGSAEPGARLRLKKEKLSFDFAAQVDEYRIGNNDVLNIFVVDHPEMSSQRVNLGQIAGTTVQKDGHVYLPVVGKVKAAGFTVVEFSEHLKQTAAKFIVEPEVSVEVLRYDSQKFYILGHVIRPGAFAVDGDTTLLEGIGLAGGIAPLADLEGSYVLRGGKLLPISLADILLRGDVERNLLMRDKDVVFVPDGADKKVYVLGEVQRPTVVPIQRERVTLAEALAVAGGPSIVSGRNEIAVLRGGYAKPIVYTVDLEVALLHDDRIALRPGDRVIVAPTGLSKASRYMQQLLPFLAGAQSATGTAFTADQLAK